MERGALDLDDEVLEQVGHARERPDGGAAATAARACAYSGTTTALSSGLSASIRSIAPSTSSAAEIAPSRTRAACAVASTVANSAAAVLDMTDHLHRGSVR